MPVGSEAAVEQVGRLLDERPPRLGAVRLVTVDGPSGSGKSTFAAALTTRLRFRGTRVELVSTDLLATWDNPFGWWPQVESGLLGPLAAGRAGLLDRVEWSTGSPLPTTPVPVPVPQVLVLEGVSSGRRAVADRVSVAVWVEVPDPQVRLTRAVGRDGDDARAHLERWQRQEAAHFGADATGSRADVLVRPA